MMFDLFYITSENYITKRQVNPMRIELSKKMGRKKCKNIGSLDFFV